MSEVDKALLKLAEAADFDRKKKELAEKELIIKGRRADNELEKLAKNDRELEIAKASNYGAMTDEQIAQVQKDSRTYIESARSCMEFINEEFNGVVPFFPKNLILIGGKTGEGKSTTVANATATTMKQLSPRTGKRCKVAILTNEEAKEDMYNRITCFSKGWAYTNHDKFTDEQLETFEKYIPILAKDGWLQVIDDHYGSTPEAPVSGVTTSVEGIQGIFDYWIKNNIIYDVVIIDYYQNVKFSKKNPWKNEWEVQAELAAMLDQYKNIYPAPIILMAQVSPPNEENTIPFKVRIEGRKVILNSCTCCMELVADRENHRTEWIVHKSRFTEHVGKSFYTGYKKGRFVPYSKEFRQHVDQIKEQRKQDDFNKQLGESTKKKVEQVNDNEDKSRASATEPVPASSG
ncbi:MAG: hypothetical protein OIN85_00670 [Candidatus Methanoperedens sp.]|nr:hypothetical protein [Candidatus Methanoperedens sp.]